MPIKSRQNIKGKVKHFLIKKMGSEEKLSVRKADQYIPTYGILNEWVLEFKQFIVQEMRREFWRNLVP
jgi:hypothetical protein